MVVVIARARSGSLGAGRVACGDRSRGQRRRGTIIRGTTDQPVSYDPAGAYDLPSYDVIYNIYQNLLASPARRQQARAGRRRDRASSPIRRPTSARSRTGLKFSDGSRPDGRGRQVLVRPQPQDRRPERRLLAAREPEERRGDRRDDRRLQPQGAGRDLAVRPDHAARFAIVPSEVYPADKLPAERRGDRLGPVQARQVRARPADRVAGEPRVHRATTRPKNDRADRPVLRPGLGAEAGGRAGRRRHRLPQPLPDRPRGPRGRRRRQGRRGRRHRDPLPRLQRRPAAGRQRRAEARDPPGDRADDRPRSRSPTTSTRAPSSRSTRRSRRASARTPSPSRTPTATRRRKAQGDPRGRRRRDARSRSRSGTPRPTTGRPRATSTRDQASARRQRPVQGQPGVDRVEPVQGGGVHRQVPAATSSAGSRTTRTPTTTVGRSTRTDSFLNIHYEQPEDGEAAGRGEGVRRRRGPRARRSA